MTVTAPASRPLGVAIIGCGRISAAHLAAIEAQPECGRLIAVADRDLARARDCAARHGVARAFDDPAALFALPEVEAVIIASPNEFHCEHAIAALRAGRHVLVEKPMAENEADARRMADAAVAAGRILAIGHTFRHTAAIRHLQDHRAQFGRLRALEVSQCVFWDGPQAPWWSERTRAQGLILSLFAPHALDFVQLVMQDDPLRVHVEATRHQDRWQGEDEAMILLRYPEGRMAQVHVSYNQRHVVDRKLIHFDRGVLRLDDGESLYWNEQPLVAPDVPLKDPHRMGGRDLAHCFRRQFAEFVTAARGLPSRSVLHEDGRRLTALIDQLLVLAQAPVPQ